MYDMTILYAENDQKLQTQYTKLFQNMFQTVLNAYDGEEAYILYLQHKPQILILDINMPKLDGLSLSKKIRKNDRETQIIILTAYSNEKNLISAIPLLLVDFLIKPVKTDHLVGTIHNTLKQLGKSKKVIINEVFTYDSMKSVLFDRQQEIHLTKNEIKLIELYIQNGIKDIMKIDTIFNYVWDDLSYSMTKLRSLINRLNGKLSQKLFISYYGIGYKIIR